MQKLKALWKKDPGLFVSASVHALAFVFLIVNFARPPKFEDAQESVPVEMITTSELNQVMNGELTAKQLPTPQRRVDKVAEIEERHPAPPLAEAKKDTPTPPAPDKPNDDPGDDDKPTPATAAAPPPPPPVPTPPERPVEKAEAPTPPPKPAPKPEPVKPPPPDAEAMEQKAPPPKPMPPARPVEKKEAKLTPPQPPRKPEPRDKPDPKKTNLDDVAKLLASMKPPKPVTKARAGTQTLDAERNHDFNIDKITALLDHEAPQRRASTGHALTQMASLGSPTSHADKMSPSMMAQLDGWLIDHYRGCWSYFGLGATQDYVPSVRVQMAQDGSLIGTPALLNPPSDPNLRSLADSAIRAVNRCNPMPVPERFKPYYESWRLRVVRFDPKEMS